MDPISHSVQLFLLVKLDFVSLNFGMKIITKKSKKHHPATSDNIHTSRILKKTSTVSMQFLRIKLPPATKEPGQKKAGLLCQRGKSSSFSGRLYLYIYIHICIIMIPSPIDQMGLGLGFYSYKPGLSEVAYPQFNIKSETNISPATPQGSIESAVQPDF